MNDCSRASSFLDRNDPKTLCSQLIDVIVLKIRTEEWKPNTKIPSENELCKIYGISRMTSRSAITQLVNDGLLYRIQGKGTYVAPQKIETQSAFYKEIVDQIQERGYDAQEQIQSIRIIKPNQRICRFLELTSDDDIYEIRSCIFIDNAPLCLHIGFLPENRFHNLDESMLRRDGLQKTLQNQFGICKGTRDESIDAIRASLEDSMNMNVEYGQPILLLEGVSKDIYQIPYLYSVIIWRTDKLKLHVHYSIE